MEADTQQEPVGSMRSFFIIWFGQLFSTTGSSVVQFALPWWLTLRAAETTDSPATVLAIASLFAVMPQVVLGPIAGALVDRWNRRIVMIVADGVIALVSLILLLLFAAGAAEIWHVYMVMFIRSLGGAFHWPAMQASTSLMVPKKHLARVAGLNETVYGAVNIAGPALGALLLELMQDMQWIMLVDVITAAVAIVPLLFVQIPQPRRADMENGEKPSVWADLRAGFRYAWNWPGLMAILIMSMVINAVLTPAFSLIPLLVKQHFLGGAPQLAVTEGAWSVGMLLGGLTLSIWGGSRRKVVTSLSGLVLMGLGIGTVGLVPSHLFWAAAIALFMGGFMNPIVNGPFFALIQGAVAPEMQGRIFMLLNSLGILATPLGLGVAGPLADGIGVPALYVIGGAVCVAMGVFGFFIPVVMKVEENGHHGAPARAALAQPVPVDLD
ncbi:MAG: MFS transporter [Anaerolineae bacterium]|nr:MFS transporter [Anaerolineae bacterium]